MDPRLLTHTADTQQDLEKLSETLEKAHQSYVEDVEKEKILFTVELELRCQELWQKCEDFMCQGCYGRLADGEYAGLGPRCNTCAERSAVPLYKMSGLYAARRAYRTLVAVGWLG